MAQIEEFSLVFIILSESPMISGVYVSVCTYTCVLSHKISLLPL